MEEGDTRELREECLGAKGIAGTKSRRPKSATDA